MNNAIQSAASLIREIDAPLASLFMSRPFHRRAIVSTLFEAMRKSDPDGYAYRVRVLLNRALDEAAAEQAIAEENQL